MPLSATAWHHPPEDATIEQYIATLDQHGVRYAVIAAASLYDDYNDYMIESTVKYKHRLRTTAIFKPSIDPYVMRLMRDDGVVGVRLQWRNVKNLPDITTPEYRKFLRRVRDLDWHVHLNQSGDLLEAPLAALEAAGVKIVVDHFGHPLRCKGAACVGQQAIMRSVEKGRTWVKLSAAYRLESPAVAEACARELIKNCGPERLLWGSDWPFAAFESTVRYADTIAAFKRCVPDDAVRRIIGGETALKLYFT
jgi:predicted TIM-barrel fold metal-dependent hydrolase